MLLPQAINLPALVIPYIEFWVLNNVSIGGKPVNSIGLIILLPPEPGWGVPQDFMEPSSKRTVNPHLLLVTIFIAPLPGPIPSTCPTGWLVFSCNPALPKCSLPVDW